MLVLPYMLPANELKRLSGSAVLLVQSQTVGYDGVVDYLPGGVAFYNAAGVHEAATGELALTLTLTLARLRSIPDAADGQNAGEWRHKRHPGLADKRARYRHRWRGREVVQALPAEHPLWRTTNTLITPPIGGHTGVMLPRVRKLLKRQIARVADGQPPLNRGL
jgi:phosphoglycerate dehydrogenase-like enzyme